MYVHLPNTVLQCESPCGASVTPNRDDKFRLNGFRTTQCLMFGYNYMLQNYCCQTTAFCVLRVDSRLVMSQIITMNPWSCAPKHHVLILISDRWRDLACKMQSGFWTPSTLGKVQREILPPCGRTNLRDKVLLFSLYNVFPDEL